MVIEAALLIGGLITTVAIGGPIAAGMARAPTFRKPVRRDSLSMRDREVHQAAFEPMDLGPDGMEWPSARPWQSSQKHTAEWPSKSWDDEHFGTHWKRLEAPSAEGPSAPAPPKATDSAPAEPSPPAPEARRSPQGRRKVPARQAPSAAELEDLIVQLGLAGTVQVIMQRTGWDFRKAAHFLAKTRQR